MIGAGEITEFRVRAAELARRRSIRNGGMSRGALGRYGSIKVMERFWRNFNNLIKMLEGVRA